MKEDHRVLSLLCGLVMALAGCAVPESQVIIHTKVVEREITVEVVKQVTRLVPYVVTATPPAPTPTPSPSPPPTFRLYFAPGTEACAGSDVCRRLVAWLEQRADLELTGIVPGSYGEAIKAVCAGLADVAWLATPAYLMAHRECGAGAVFSVVRYGSATSRGQMVVQANQVREARGLEPIRSLEDLRGKSFAFTNLLSTTGYLFPQATLIDAGIELGERLFVGGDAQAVLAVYRGEVDAAASYWGPMRPDGSPGDARAALLGTHPDVARVVKVLQLSSPVPNDPIVFRHDLPPEVRDRLVTAFVDLTKSEDGRQVLEELYGVSGLVPVGDRDYDVVREMGSTLGLEFEEMLQGRYLAYDGSLVTNP